MLLSCVDTHMDSFNMLSATLLWWNAACVIVVNCLGARDSCTASWWDGPGASLCFELYSLLGQMPHQVWNVSLFTCKYSQTLSVCRSAGGCLPGEGKTHFRLLGFSVALKITRRSPKCFYRLQCSSLNARGQYWRTQWPEKAERLQHLRLWHMVSGTKMRHWNLHCGSAQ